MSSVLFSGFSHFYDRAPDQKHLKVGKAYFGSWFEDEVHHGEEGVMARAWNGSAVGTQREMNAVLCFSLLLFSFNPGYQPWDGDTHIQSGSSLLS